MSKKSIVFSVVAIFICLIIIALAFLLIGDGMFSLNNNYYQARLLFLNSEIKYFEDTYLPQSLQFASYNCLYYVLGYYNSNPSTCNGNYSCFEEDFYECLMNGSINGVTLSGIINKSLGDFVSNYIVQERENGLNVSVTFKAFNVSEKVPYYVDVDVEYNIVADAVDNLSFWNNTHSNSVRFSVYDISDPLWKYEAGVDLPVRSAEYYSSLGSVDRWNQYVFNESLQEGYAYSYKNGYVEYTIGNSFLGRLINYSFPVMMGSLGLWDFDYDTEKGISFLWDLSSLGESGILKGDTLVAYSFDNVTLNLTGNEVYDMSGYRNNGSLNGVVFTNSSCVSGDCFVFGPGDNITTSLDVNLGQKFGIAMWIRPFSNDTFVMEKVNDFKILINDSRLLWWGFNGSDWNEVSSLGTLVPDQWNSVVVTYSNGQEVVFLNGVRDSNIGNFYIENSSSKLILGGSPGFNGSIDEVGVYIRSLTGGDVVSSIFNSRRVYFVDYVNSLFLKGVDFESDGRYGMVPVNFSLGDHYTISFWILPFNYSSNLNERQGILILKNSTDSITPFSNDGLRFFLNGNDKLEWDIYPGEIGNLVSNFSVGRWNYFVAVFDGTVARLYWNGHKVYEVASDMRKSNLNMVYFPFLASAHFFRGIIDEIRVYNRTLSDRDILNSYLDYNSFGKGLNRYVILVNPNKFGFNDTYYKRNVSYSDVLFFKYWDQGLKYNYTLFNLTNFTSSDPAVPYYNFLLDECMMEAFNVFDWDTKTGIVYVGNDSANCLNEIYKGWY